MEGEDSRQRKLERIVRVSVFPSKWPCDLLVQLLKALLLARAGHLGFLAFLGLLAISTFGRDRRKLGGNMSHDRGDGF